MLQTLTHLDSAAGLLAVQKSACFFYLDICIILYLLVENVNFYHLVTLPFILGIGYRYSFSIGYNYGC